MKDNRDGTFALNYTPKECGKYVLDVAYDGVAVPGSPFEFEVTEGGPDKVKVYGKGNWLIKLVINNLLTTHSEKKLETWPT